MDEHNNSGYDNKGTFRNGSEDWSENKQQEYSNQYNHEQHDPYEKSGNYGNQPNSNNMYNGYPNGNMPNYGYNQYNGGYPDRWNVQPDEKTGNGFAVASFAIALLNMLFFKSLFSIITVPVCIILGILCFAKHGRGKGFAVAGMIISVISACICAFYIAFIVQIYPDIKYFMENDTQIVTEFVEEGTIPDRYKKYLDPKFDKYWKSAGFDSFNEIFGKFIEGYLGQPTESRKTQPYTDYYEDETEEYEDDYGFDHDGEELVVL